MQLAATAVSMTINAWKKARVSGDEAGSVEEGSGEKDMSKWCRSFKLLSDG